MVTESQIQAIVDGECSHELRALLLREIENQPSEWRTLALALLEEQQWTKELKAASLDRIASVEAATGLPVVNPLVRPKSAENETKADRKMATPWLSMLAACLLLGLGIYGGSLIPKFGNGQSSATIAGNNSSTAASGVNSSILVPRESDLKMLVSGPNKETSEIPIYDLSPPEQDVLFARELVEMARINQRLRREGYELDIRPEYYTGKMNDGRNLVVPVKHIGVRPYGL